MKMIVKSILQSYVLHRKTDQVKKWIQCYDYAYGALILQGNKIFMVTNVSEW